MYFPNPEDIDFLEALYLELCLTLDKLNKDNKIDKWHPEYLKACFRSSLDVNLRDNFNDYLDEIEENFIKRHQITDDNGNPDWSKF